MVTGTKVNLRNQFYQQISQRIQMRMQETARFQSMARANMQSLQMNQQRLAQTLAQNSQAMSNMIMDSWNQKQASPESPRPVPRRSGASTVTRPLMGRTSM